MSRYRVLIADPITEVGLAPLARDPNFELIDRSALGDEALADALVGIDAVIVRSMTRITRSVLTKVAQLSAIGRAGARADTVASEAASPLGTAALTATTGYTPSS